MVEWVWSVYAPGGQLLSKQERNEAYERFEKWRRTGRYWDQKIDGDSRSAKSMGGRKLDPARPVSFLEFKKWFLHLATYLEHLHKVVIHREDTPTPITPPPIDEESTSVNILAPMSTLVAHLEDQDLIASDVVPEDILHKEEEVTREDKKEEEKEEETEFVHSSILSEPQFGTLLLPLSVKCSVIMRAT